MDINLEYKKTQVNKVNQGTYFKLRPTETAPVWVRANMTKPLRLILAISTKILIMRNSSRETEKYT
jgi:hypothetical protein